MEILLEAYRELQEQNIEEKVILTSDIYRNSEINYDRFANYVDFQHFLDCLGYNTGHQPRILANYRSEGKGSSRASDTDSDFSGIHICFSNDLYNEPIVMPKLDCGFIFERDVLEKLALDQGWTKPIEHNDFLYRLQNTYKFDGDNNPNYERDLKPKRGRRPKEMDASEIVPAQTAQVLRLQGLLKVKNKNGNLEYWVCFSQWTWREVSEDFYNLLKKWIDDKRETLDGRAYLDSKNLIVYPDDIEKINNSRFASLNPKEVEEGYFFGDVSKFDDNIPAVKNVIQGPQLVLSNDDNRETDRQIAVPKDLAKYAAKNFFNEYETRIYRRNPKERFNWGNRYYLNFSLEDVSEICLPKILMYKSVQYRLDNLYNIYNENKKDRLSNLFEDKQTYTSVSPIAYYKEEIERIENPERPDEPIFCIQYNGNRTRLCTRALLYRYNEILETYEICTINDGVELPGGGIDCDIHEDAFTACKREIFEELPWLQKSDLSRLRYVSCYLQEWDSKWVQKNLPKDKQFNHYFNYLFIGEVTGDCPNFGRTGDRDEFQWIPVSDFFRNTHVKDIWKEKLKSVFNDTDILPHGYDSRKVKSDIWSDIFVGNPPAKVNTEYIKFLLDIFSYIDKEGCLDKIHFYIKNCI